MCHMVVTEEREREEAGSVWLVKELEWKKIYEIVNELGEEANKSFIRNQM